MNRVHDLKCWPEPFRAIVAGEKRHEFRRDDRGFAVGDVLYLHEFDPTPRPGSPIGRPTEVYTVVRVTYVGRGFGIPDGFVCMSVRPASEGLDRGFYPSCYVFLAAQESAP